MFLGTDISKTSVSGCNGIGWRKGKLLQETVLPLLPLIRYIFTVEWRRGECRKGEDKYSGLTFWNAWRIMMDKHRSGKVSSGSKHVCYTLLPIVLKCLVLLWYWNKYENFVNTLKCIFNCINTNVFNEKRIYIWTVKAVRPDLKWTETLAPEISGCVSIISQVLFRDKIVIASFYTFGITGLVVYHWILRRSWYVYITYITLPLPKQSKLLELCIEKQTKFTTHVHKDSIQWRKDYPKQK